jgi:hypothetical protein
MEILIDTETYAGNTMEILIDTETYAGNTMEILIDVSVSMSISMVLPAYSCSHFYSYI